MVIGRRAHLGDFRLGPQDAEDLIRIGTKHKDDVDQIVVVAWAQHLISHCTLGLRHGFKSVHAGHSLHLSSHLSCSHHHENLVGELKVGLRFDCVALCCLLSVENVAQLLVLLDNLLHGWTGSRHELVELKSLILGGSASEPLASSVRCGFLGWSVVVD